MSESMIHRAYERLPGISLHHANAANLSDIVSDESQDVVCLLQMWHHLDEQARIDVAKEVYRVLRPG